MGCMNAKEWKTLEVDIFLFKMRNYGKSLGRAEKN
jgi:hypothetical protein